MCRHIKEHSGGKEEGTNDYMITTRDKKVKNDSLKSEPTKKTGEKVKSDATTTGVRKVKSPTKKTEEKVKNDATATGVRKLKSEPTKKTAEKVKNDVTATGVRKVKSEPTKKTEEKVKNDATVTGVRSEPTKKTEEKVKSEPTKKTEEKVKNNATATGVRKVKSEPTKKTEEKVKSDATATRVRMVKSEFTKKTEEKVKNESTKEMGEKVKNNVATTGVSKVKSESMKKTEERVITRKAGENVRSKSTKNIMARTVKSEPMKKTGEKLKKVLTKLREKKPSKTSGPWNGLVFAELPSIVNFYDEGDTHSILSSASSNMMVPELPSRCYLDDAEFASSLKVERDAQSLTSNASSNQVIPELPARCYLDDTEFAHSLAVDDTREDAQSVASDASSNQVIPELPTRYYLDDDEFAQSLRVDSPPVKTALQHLERRYLEDGDGDTDSDEDSPKTFRAKAKASTAKPQHRGGGASEPKKFQISKDGTVVLCKDFSGRDKAVISSLKRAPKDHHVGVPMHHHTLEKRYGKSTRPGGETENPYMALNLQTLSTTAQNGDSDSGHYMTASFASPRESTAMKGFVKVGAAEKAPTEGNYMSLCEATKQQSRGGRVNGYDGGSGQGGVARPEENGYMALDEKTRQQFTKPRAWTKF